MDTGISLMHNPTAFPMPVQDGNMTRIIMPGASIRLKNPVRRNEKAPKRLNNLHKNNQTVSFGMVYANDLAKAEFEKKKPDFPVGSIIVREKNTEINSETPEIFIVMAKRKKGFSKKTDDWEFLNFNGADLKLQTRETKSDCSKCHLQAKKTDWVFRNYLKQNKEDIFSIRN